MTRDFLFTAVTSKFISYTLVRSGIHPDFFLLIHWKFSPKTIYDKLSESLFFFQQTITVNSRAKHSQIYMFLTSIWQLQLRYNRINVSTIILTNHFIHPHYYNKQPSGMFKKREAPHFKIRGFSPQKQKIMLCACPCVFGNGS